MHIYYNNDLILQEKGWFILHPFFKIESWMRKVSDLDPGFSSLIRNTFFFVLCVI
jgi:hypothetical protein